MIAELSPVTFSRMVGRGGRGRGANDPPPPPDYMAAMMQQFQMHQEFMQGIMAQFPNQNQNQNQQHGVTLRDFVHLNPATFHKPDQPLEADDWLRDITRQLESARVDAADYVTFATFFLRGPAAQWWDTHRVR